MDDIFGIMDFLDPINTDLLSSDEGYKDGQLGKVIKVYNESFPELEEVDIVLVGLSLIHI